jgi:SAM-dependent methyltransferase
MPLDPEQILADNRQAWDAVSDLFTDASALPYWGPFGVGDDLDLLPEIEDKVFLEMGCGSGRSLQYLLQNGARKVYGLDLSARQIEEARRCNRQAAEAGKADFFQALMEEKIDIEPVDCVFSVYAIGWTVAPEKTFRHIYGYLKKGGRFIWSWEHSAFIDVRYDKKQFVIDNSYHQEKLFTFPNWKDRPTTPHVTYRKISTWFQLLRDAGFNITGYFEPAPKNLRNGHQEPEAYYSFPKAQLVPATFIFVCQK